MNSPASVQVGEVPSESSAAEFRDYVCEGKSFGRIVAETNLAFARAWRNRRTGEALAATGDKKSRGSTVETEPPITSVTQSVGPIAQVARESNDAPLVEPASSGDVSVMEAFNPRDMNEVDRAVAAKRSCTDSGEHEDEEPAAPRSVKPRLNFDEADDDGAMSQSEQAEECSEDGGSQPAIKRHRRLGQKAQGHT